MSEKSLIKGKTPWQAARAENAQKRQAMRDDRSPQEQLALLDDRPGESKRERARLTVAAVALNASVTATSAPAVSAPEEPNTAVVKVRRPRRRSSKPT